MGWQKKVFKTRGTRTDYPRDVSDEEWAFCAPYLTLMHEEAPPREYPLRGLFNALRYMIRAGFPWRMIPNGPAAVVYGASAGATLDQGGLF